MYSIVHISSIIATFYFPRKVVFLLTVIWSIKHTVYLGHDRLGTQHHPNRWSQLGLSRESSREKHTVTVRPGRLYPTAFCYTDPNHRTPALHLPHFQTSLVRHAERFEEDVKVGKYTSQRLSFNPTCEAKAQPSPPDPKPSSGFSNEHRGVQIWWGDSITGGHLPTHAGLWLWALRLP